MSTRPKFRLSVTALNLGAAVLAVQSQAAPLNVVRPGRVTPQPAPVGVISVHSATLSPSLAVKLAALTNLSDVVPGTVIVAFNTATGLAGVSGLDALLARNAVAVTPTAGHRFEALGMISARLTKGQVLSLQNESAVASLGANDRLYYQMHQARVLCGVDKLRADAAMTAANGGRIVDGTGAAGQQFAVAVIDSGIDTRNTDLPFDNVTSVTGVPTTKVLQNVQIVGDDAAGTVTYGENLVTTDTVNHGTHCSGIVAGSGAFSRTTAATAGPGAGATEDFSGVAGRFTGATIADARTATSGVKLVGLGSGAVLFILDALGGFEYVLQNQVKYNIRVTSNSYGSTGAYQPDSALNKAIQQAYNAGITNVFAAGNSGPGVDTIGDSSKNPAVISVAAGTKEGGLASFSSRGLPSAQRTGLNAYNFPAITAPGTGREFLFDGPYDPAAMSPFVAGASAANPNTVGRKFYSDMISTRCLPGGPAVGTNDQEFATPYQSNYTMISGTSMATPFVAGTCALLLSANPGLTPAGIKAVLQSTATHMPDYQDFEVGAGYLNAYAAVDLALNPGKPYAPFNRMEAPYAANYPAFITTINAAPLDPTLRPAGYPPATLTTGASHDEDFVQPFNAQSVSAADYPGVKAKATTNDNAYAFVVDADASGTPNVTNPTLKTTVLDVRIQFGNDSAAGVAGGNSIGLLLWAPDGTFYSSGIALPVEDAPNRQVVVKNPKPGLWVAELRGLRGLAAVPITPPTGVGLPDTTTGQIYRSNQTITNPPGDINGIPQNQAITFALLNRYLDQVSSGLFKPTQSVTRGDVVQVLADNVPLRQSLATGTSPYTDATGAQARFAEAAAQFGSTLRDFDFTPGPTLQTNSTTFTPGSYLNRMQAVIAMVRALGLDAEARNLAGTAVKVNLSGTPTAVSDARTLPASQLGYLQLALNRGLLNTTVDFQGRVLSNPTKTLTRADLATMIVNFRNVFRAGNSLAATEYAPQAP